MLVKCQLAYLNATHTRSLTGSSVKYTVTMLLGLIAIYLLNTSSLSDTDDVNLFTVATCCYLYFHGLYWVQVISISFNSPSGKLNTHDEIQLKSESNSSNMQVADLIGPFNWAGQERMHTQSVTKTQEKHLTIIMRRNNKFYSLSLKLIETDANVTSFVRVSLRTISLSQVLTDSITFASHMMIN